MWERAKRRELLLLESDEKGEGFEDFMRMNNIPQEKQQEEWQKHIEWRKGYIKYVNRKLRESKKRIQEAS